MRIFRKLLYKLFALNNQEFLSTHSRLVLLNLLKCFELYNLNKGININHWVNKAVNSTLSLSKKYRLPQDMFSILDASSPLSDTERGNIPKIRINYNLQHDLSKEEIKSIISRCILTVCGENDYFKWEDEV